MQKKRRQLNSYILTFYLLFCIILSLYNYINNNYYKYAITFLLGTSLNVACNIVDYFDNEPDAEIIVAEYMQHKAVVVDREKHGKYSVEAGDQLVLQVYNRHEEHGFILFEELFEPLVVLVTLIMLLAILLYQFVKVKHHVHRVKEKGHNNLVE